MSNEAVTRRRGGKVGGLLRGVRAFLAAPGLLSRYRLWRYLLAPALLSLLMSTAIVAALVVGFDNFHDWIDAKIALQTKWLDAVLSWSASILAVIALGAVFVFLHKHLVLVLLAPFLGRLAEMTVRGIEGEKFRQRVGAVDSIVRSAKVNTRSIALVLLAGVVFFVVGLMVPIVGSLLSSVALILIQNCYLGNGLLDFPLEYRGRSTTESVAFCKAHRGEATGLGLGYFLTMLVPVVGWMLAPTLGTVAGTGLAMDLLGDDDDEDGQGADR